jgi:LDH2 family malate/lactate/ureidoglycolate dehydrogenase
MVKVTIKEIRKILEQKLHDLHFHEREARIIADEYVASEVKGKIDHGIFGFIDDYKKIKLYPRRHFAVVKNRPAYAYITGNDDVGQLIGDYAINLAIQKAKRMGIAMVGGNNMKAFLRPGTWAEAAAKKQMIGLCFIYGGGPLVAPTGAREAILSTNPIGIGIPYQPMPIVIDFAVSRRAFYHVRMARALGNKIPADWGIDATGKPTTDPNKLIAVLPFGGYKGYALGLALEILTGPLVRAKVGTTTDKKRGFLFVVIDPQAFTTMKEFNRDVKILIRQIKTAKKAKGIREIFIPGEKSFRIERQNKKKGFLDIDERIIKEIKAL